MVEYLVESALLTHGLRGIEEEELLREWPEGNQRIAWMEEGKLVIGGMQRFCDFRKRAGTYGRVNYQNYADYVISRKSGVLTASGTMKACEEKGIPLAVTCGMGGLMNGQPKEECHDIQALAVSPVSLIATAPKDMFNLKETIRGMKEEGIVILGDQSDECNGYMFVEEPVGLSGRWNSEAPTKGVLFLKKIPENKRIMDRRILDCACVYGIEQEKQDKYFHPAVNAKIDELTCGESSRIQLQSIIENVAWAEIM